MPNSRLWRLHLLGKLPHLACWKLLLIYIGIIDGFGNQILFFKKKTENISMQDTCSFWWVLGKKYLSFTVLYHSSTEQFPCLKLVSRSNLTLASLVCGLQESSYLAQITSKLKSSAGKHHNTCWSFPKSPLHAMTFLHFLDSGNMASSQSKIFSHFSFHLRNYGTSYQSQSNPSWALQYNT